MEVLRATSKCPVETSLRGTAIWQGLSNSGSKFLAFKLQRKPPHVARPLQLLCRVGRHGLGELGASLKAAAWQAYADTCMVGRTMHLQTPCEVQYTSTRVQWSNLLISMAWTEILLA